VFDLHKVFSPEPTREWAAAGCRSAGIGCLDCKSRLADHMIERLAEVHARRPALEARPDTVWDILRDGNQRARAAAQATMSDVRQAMQVAYPEFI
jgi:tryptophanyl-tRNA synthetase